MVWARLNRKPHTAAVIFLAASAAPLFAQTNPYLVSYDLRVHGTNAKEAYVTKAGDIITLDLFATVYQYGTSFSDDGIQSTDGSFLSSNGGLKGDLLGLTAPNPFNPSDPGGQHDLDGDGDLDVGGVNPGDMQNSFYYARASSVVYNSSPNTEFFIGRAQFTATSLAASSTQISWAPRVYKAINLIYGTLLYKDGKPFSLMGNDARVFVNTPVTVRTNQVIDPGTIQYISGVVPQHLSVSGTVMPTAGSTVSLTGGIDVAATGSFNAAGAGNSIDINDTISANNGGSIFVPTFSVATTAAAATFSQNSGLTSVSSALNVGSSSYQGTLDISGGAISSPLVNVSAGSSIHQTGGDVTFTTLNLKGASAKLLFDGGTLNATDLDLSQDASATVNAGTLTVNNQLAVGNNGAGTLVINGGDIHLGSLTVGLKNPGAVVQNDGTVTGVVHVGRLTNPMQTGTSSYTLNGGTIAGSVTVTDNNSVFIQNGGTVTGNPLQLLSVRAKAPAQASYELHAGLLERPGSTFIAWDELFARGSSYSGSGSITQTGGVANLGSLMIGQNGLYTLAGGSLRINKTLDSHGTLDFANSTSTFTAGGTGFVDFSRTALLRTSNATVIGEAGSLINLPTSFDPLTAFAHFTSDGLVHVNGQALVIPPNVAVHGSGTIEGDVTNNGTLSPGNSPGELDIVGNFTHTAQAKLEIELAGNTSDLFDLVTATGTANLQGLLSVNLLGDYVPLSTDQFPILTAANITGTFANAASGIDTAAGHFDVLYTPGSVVLANFSPVPEPTVALLVAVPLLMRRRRR